LAPKLKLLGNCEIIINHLTNYFNT